MQLESRFGGLGQIESAVRQADAVLESVLQVGADYRCREANGYSNVHDDSRL